MGMSGIKVYVVVVQCAERCLDAVWSVSSQKKLCVNKRQGGVWLFGHVELLMGLLSDARVCVLYSHLSKLNTFQQLELKCFQYSLSPILLMKTKMCDAYVIH